MINSFFVLFLLNYTIFFSVIKEIRRINNLELNRNTVSSSSWHDDYSHSAYVYIGGLPFSLTEGDVICIFSQYGEVVDINLLKDKSTGKSKGFCFIAYEDQRSTILAVDNFNGTKVCFPYFIFSNIFTFSHISC
eukprot:Sdes_comp17601_c0_seq1m6857